jgi:hypothetical protein
MNFKISIPQPCHEDWSKMTSVDRGRFCNACQKVVTDFTWMSDAEIIQHLKASSANSCGRFTATQVNRNLIEQTPQKRLWLNIPKFSAAASIIFSLLQLPVFAQTKKEVKVEQTELQKSDSIKLNSNKEERKTFSKIDSALTYTETHNVDSTSIIKGGNCRERIIVGGIEPMRFSITIEELLRQQTPWQRFKRKLKRIF